MNSGLESAAFVEALGVDARRISRELDEDTPGEPRSLDRGLDQYPADTAAAVGDCDADAFDLRTRSAPVG